MHRLKTVSLSGVLLVILLAAAGSGLWRLARGRYPPPVAVTIAMQPFEYGGLVYVAEERGYLRDAGITVQWLDTTSGPAALDAMAAGEADLAICGEYPLVARVLVGAPLSVLAAVDKFETWYLVARKSRGIATLADLVGKRVAVQRGTLGEFYLGRMLELSGLPANSVTLVDTPLLQMGAALLDGAVDASLALQYDLAALQRGLGDDALVLPAQSGQFSYGLLLARDEWVSGHGEEIRRLLRALARAERDVAERPTEAREIVRRWLGYDEETMLEAWSLHQLSLSLDRSLLIAMEDEGRWMIAHRLTTASELPDLLHYIDVSHLALVRPEAVNIYR